jgi:ubiquinone/menaquinone biosynthesis C-methylase UbiE
MGGETLNCIKPFKKENDIFVYLEQLNREQKNEDDIFQTSATESESAPAYKSLMHKIQSLHFFRDILNRYNISLNGTLLELGGGYGYLSAYIKAEFPAVTVIYSDVSKTAVKKSRQFEDLFKSSIDEKWVTSAEDIPFADNQFDIVLINASFHHWQNPLQGLRECSRVLKKGGKLLLFMEPSCPAYLKNLYNAHVHRETIKENYYTVKEYRTMVSNAGLLFKNYNYRNFLYRWNAKTMFYYFFLGMLPEVFIGFFPCTQVIIAYKGSETL